MKQICTLLAAVFAALTSFAQISTNFTGGTTSLTSFCWKVPAGALPAVMPNSATGISGDALRFNAIGTYDLSTPFLDYTGLFTVTFDYLIDDNLGGNASRTIQIGTTDKNGVFTPQYNTIVIGNPGNKSNSVIAKITLTNLVSRLTLRVVGTNGDGKCHVVLDNIKVEGAALHYAPIACNTAPVAKNEFYYATTQTQQISGNVLVNDIDENAGESAVSATLVTAPATGTLTFNRDGSFSYTPPAGFSGGDVTFQYKATDNGYDPLESGNTATVTIVYPENATPLPVKLASFAGRLHNEKAQLNWKVADNENASHFEIQQSSNGYDFTTTALSFATSGSGAASYQFAHVFAGQKQYYRLKIWDKEGAFEYSNVVALQSGTAAAQTLKLWQPASNKISLQFGTATAQQLQLTVVNLAGMVVHHQTLNSLAGTNAPSVVLAQPLKPGIYLVHLQNAATTFSAKLLVP
jgi:hypothetical protein